MLKEILDPILHMPKPETARISSRPVFVSHFESRNIQTLAQPVESASLVANAFEKARGGDE